MNATPSTETLARLYSALEQAHANGADMLSVVFPCLPVSAFDALARTTPVRTSFCFENEKKELAEAGLDFRDAFPRYEHFSFDTIEDLIPSNREVLFLNAESQHLSPAPKIFVTGTFDDSVAPFAAIPTWQLSRSATATRICAHISLKSAKIPSPREILSEYEQLKAAPETASGKMCLPEIQTATEVGGNTYATRAACAIEKIESGAFEKIVLARAKDFTFSANGEFPAGALYSALRERFLQSGCTIFSARRSAQNPHEKIIGATPELLVRIQNRKLETEDLAGTVTHDPKTPDACAAQLLNDDKERREHRLVVDFITEKLRTRGLTPDFPEIPEILRLPNVFHLHTPIEARIAPDKISIGQIVSALHPTPAMCGVPAASAKQFISATEPFPRENFSAPVGFVDADGNGFFAVAIRCAKIFENKIRLYAGSGLVKGSRPQKEYHEIEAKISALLSVFNNVPAPQKILEKTEY